MFLKKSVLSSYCLIVLLSTASALGKKEQKKSESVFPIEYSKTGKGPDRINCGSPEWQIFSDAVKRFCGAIDNNQHCWLVRSAFTTCRMPTDFGTFGKTSYYTLQPLSKSQLQALPGTVRLVYYTEGKDTDTNYSVDFVLKNGNWEVTDIGLDPPCAG